MVFISWLEKYWILFLKVEKVKLEFSQIFSKKGLKLKIKLEINVSK